MADDNMNKNDIGKASDLNHEDEELDLYKIGLKDFSDEVRTESTGKSADDSYSAQAVEMMHTTENKGGAAGHRPRPDGQHRRPNGQSRPRHDGQHRRPQNAHGKRPNGARPRPEGAPARKRPDGARPRPEGAAARRRPDGTRPVGRPEGENSAQGTKKKGWSKKKKTVLITVISVSLVVILLVALILILFFSYTGKLNRTPDTKVNSGERPIDSSELVSKADTISKEEQLAKLKEMLSKRSSPITNDNVMNILLVGEDLRDTSSGERGNTDVQMLVSINKEKKKIVLASFLRDQYLEVGNYGMNRLNSAYWHEGIPLLKDTISKYYNVKIDRYVLVNFYSFIDVIEAIGGVDVDVNQDEMNAMQEAIREHNKYLKNPAEKDYLSKAGKQHLNGNQALAYVRVREGCGDDYGRTERQREMISIAVQKLKSLSILELDSLINKVAPQITTDISDGEIASLILNAGEIMGYQVCQVQMPHYPYFKEEVINNMAVLTPDYDKCCTLLLDMIYGDSTTVEQAIQKMDAGTINQYTYTNGGNKTETADPNAQQQQQQQDPNQNTLQ